MINQVICVSDWWTFDVGHSLRFSLLFRLKGHDQPPATSILSFFVVPSLIYMMPSRPFPLTFLNHM